MPRTFNGTTDFITTGLGLVGGVWIGTIAAIVRKTADGAGRQIIEVGNGATARYGLYTNASNQLSVRANADVAFTTPTIVAADGWVLIAVTKATGTTVPQFHILKTATGVWSHGAGAATSANNTSATTQARISRNVANTSFWTGDIAAIGIWQSTQLTNAQVEALAGSWNAWFQVNPSGLWVLDQAATGMAVNDWSGGGANQSAITGTTIGTSSSPIPYSYGGPILIPQYTVAAGPTEHFAAATLTGTGSLTGAATRTRFASATLSGTGTLAAAATRTRFATAALSGTGALTAAATRVRFATATLTGTGALTANGTVTGPAPTEWFGSAALTGTGTLTAVGKLTARATATLAGTGSLTAAGTVSSLTIPPVRTVVAPSVPVRHATMVRR